MKFRCVCRPRASYSDQLFVNKMMIWFALIIDQQTALLSPHSSPWRQLCVDTRSWFLLQVHLQYGWSDPGRTTAGQVPGPVLPEQLIPKTVNDWAHETRDDVDDQKEDVSDFQAQAGEEGDERRLKRRNHKGQHAE